MQRAASFHGLIADTHPAEAAGVVHDATAFDAAATCSMRTCEGTAPGLPGRHDDLDLAEHERQEAQILEQATPRRQAEVEVDDADKSNSRED
jgi:hypothetical protein